MACYHPMTAFLTEGGAVIFAERGKIQRILTLPCGQCIGCRLERSRHWAIRCMHEASQHEENSFLNLTYNDENLVDRYITGYKNNKPLYSGTLHYRHWQLFAKKLRNTLSRENTKQPRLVGPTDKRDKIRFYMCGEYGDQLGRPHYHACLFGHDFKDKVYYKTTKTGFKLYTSPQLEQLWPHGFATIGNVTFETAAYVARYVMKKITGNRKTKHYEKIDTETGEIKKLKQEFNQMSRRPGIGANWLHRYTADVYPKGKVITRGYESNAPRYYDKMYKKLDPQGFEEITQFGRQLEALMQPGENSDARLAARETVTKAKIALLKRTLE